MDDLTGLNNFSNLIYEFMWRSPLLPMVGLLLCTHGTEFRFARSAIWTLTALDLFTEMFNVWAIEQAKIIEHGMPIIHGYEIIVGVILLSIFARLLKGFIPVWIIWSANVITFSLGIYAWLAEGPYALYSWPYSIVQVCVLILSLLYLLKVFFDSKIKDLLNYLPFWLVSAILIYNGAMMFVTLFERVVRAEMGELFLYSHLIILFTSILYNVIFFVGIVRTGKFRFSAERKRPLTE